MEPEHFPGGHDITTKEELIHYLRRNRVIKSAEVEEIMNTIDRALFVCPGSRPYMDSIQPLGYYDAAISSPVQHAICLELLKDHLRPGMNVLDIGSDGTQGLLKFAPYDAIHFGGLAEQIYPALTRQLKHGGRLVIPVRGNGRSSGLTVVDKKADGTLNESIKYRVLPNADGSRESQQ